MVAADWSSTQPVSSQTSANRPGQPWDLDDNDDVNQYLLTIARLDSPEVFRDTAARGELAINWGLYPATAPRAGPTTLSSIDFTLGGDPGDDVLVPRAYKTLHPRRPAAHRLPRPPSRPRPPPSARSTGSTTSA
ncbi:MAG: hypothetical protein R2939_04920 [Kofleriaceae bacterium]